MSSDRYAVFGNPVSHSRSPDIHAAFARQTGEDLIYTKQHIELDTFVDNAQAFFADGGKGLNITLPFKTEAFDFSDTLSERAQRAGAVNTLTANADGTILGDNTDGIGLVRDMLDNLNWKISGQRILVIGAGGAVRGILEPLLSQSPASLVIANRTLAKALQLAEDFADLGKVLGVGFGELEALSPFDLVINGTSASLSGELPPLPENLVTENACAYDMMYAAEPTVFMQWMEQRGVNRLADGLGMLVEQAAESFYLWRGVRPATSTLITELRGDIQKQSRITDK